MKKPKRHFLDIKCTLSENDICVGLVTPARGYRLAWTINHLLSIQLSKALRKVFEQKEGENLVLHTHYFYESAQEVYRLIQNKLEGEDHSVQALIKEWKAFDYLLLCQISFTEQEKMLKELHNCSLLQHVSQLEVESKYIEKLMF